MIRSPSGDVDILVLFLLHADGTRVLIANGTGNARKIIDIHSEICHITKKSVRRFGETCLFALRICQKVKRKQSSNVIVFIELLPGT